MKKYLLIASFAFLLLESDLLAQTKTPINSFKISNNKSPDKEELYKITIAKADMESFRLQDRSVVIKFEEGFECVLLSARTLANMGASIDIDSYKKEFSPAFNLPKFHIDKSGIIVALIEKSSK